MNKSGFLLAEETLKIILAVIAIGFLIYFLTSLYFSKVNDQKLVQANRILLDSSNSIKAKIENLENKNPEEIQLVNPQSWYLFGFVEAKKPNSCIGRNCLCICDKVLVDNFWILAKDRQARECDKIGACLIVENLKTFDKIKINKQWIIIKEENNLIEIKEK